MPDQRAKALAPSKTQKGAAAIAAAVLVAAPLATEFEGYRGKAYLDPASILTVCYGETENVDPSRIYSKDECAAQLRKRMARDYAPTILDCLPALAEADRRYVFGALLDAAYNAGAAAICKSPMAVRIKAGNWTGACAALSANYIVGGMLIHGWFASAKNRKTGVRKEFPGLVKRRKAEAATCLTIVPATEPPKVVISSPSGAQVAPATVPAPPRRPTIGERAAAFFHHLFGGAA